MKRHLLLAAALCALQPAARADLVRLVSGKSYQGAVTVWGNEEISFVLQGGAMGDAFTIPVRLIEFVVLPDSTAHQPGTASWIASGRLERLPWERQSAATITAEQITRKKVEPINLLSLKNYELRLAATGGMQSGYTTYQISFPWEPYTGNSRLDFPLDGYYAGIRASALSRPAGESRAQFGISLEYAMRLSDPRKEMTDSDWISVSSTGSTSQDNYRLVFSATTSTSKCSGWDLTMAATALLPFSSQFKAGALLGYHHLRLSYDIYGVAGWQDTTFNGNIVYFDELQNTRVGQYAVSYKLPMLGLVLLSESAEGLTLQARGAYLFSATADDEDRHLLRNKKSTCSASGSGWQLDGEAWLRLATLANKSTLLLGGSYEYLKVDTKGSQTQTYYGDDPSFPGNETGQSISGIDDKLFIYRHSFSGFLTYTF